MTDLGEKTTKMAEEEERHTPNLLLLIKRLWRDKFRFMHLFAHKESYNEVFCNIFGGIRLASTK